MKLICVVGDEDVKHHILKIKMPFLVAASSEVRGKAGATLYYPWLCVTSILVVLDLAGSVYHFVDIFSTTVSSLEIACLYYKNAS